MHEFEWIAHYFAPLTHGRSEALGLKDDAALLQIPDGMQLVITTDTLNAGVHFLADAPAQFIAHKALAVNVSDLAAMGASPLAYNLALSLPKDINEPWLGAFCAGLLELQKETAIFLLGGDTTYSQGPLSITITAFGCVEKGTALLRSGAQAGDRLYTTGTIGDGYLGLLSAQREWGISDVEKRYYSPSPRVAVGKALSGIATSCMDISDGLLQDAGHIAQASGMALIIHAPEIPLSHSAQQLLAMHPIALTDLLAGGDDYELLFTASPQRKAEISEIAVATGVAIHEIGEVTKGAHVALLDSNGQPIRYERGGWQHF